MSLLARDFLAPFRRRPAPAAPLAEAEPVVTGGRVGGRVAGRSPANRLAKRLRQRRRAPAFGSAENLERRLALAVVTPFDVRFTANDTGDITFAANTIMTAPGDSLQAQRARAGIPDPILGDQILNDDFWDMAYVDIDGDSTTFNSSSADLFLPSDAEVLFAGLYWGGRARGQTQFDNLGNVKFRGPDDATYRNLSTTIISSTTQGAPSGSGARNYQSFIDVTDLVRSQGAGTYTTANVQAFAGAKNYSAGWSLVVAFREPGAAARNLTVFDGFAYVTTSDPDVTINISGFQAPPAGPVTGTLGFVAYEGDLGITGDRAFFNGGLGEQQLSNATNPANNFFNSSISDLGVGVTAKNPDYVNQLGFGADLLAADGLIANGATSGTVRLTTTQDFYYPGVITSAIDLYAPKVSVVKGVTDLDGGEVLAGDTLRYTITVSNAASALDAAAGLLLEDAIPANTTYVPGSLVITAGANSGGKTDAVDADQGEYVALEDTVRFQLGTGAGGALPVPAGGRLAPGQSTTVSFDVTINPDVLAGTIISNTSRASFTAETSRFELFAVSNRSEVRCRPSADLAITKTDGQLNAAPGEELTYTIVVTNNGPDPVTGAAVSDLFPATLTDVSWTVSYTGGGSGPLAGSNNIAVAVNLPAMATATFLVTATIDPLATGTLSNTATVSPPAGVTDRNPSNNTATDTTVLLPEADLAVVKTRTSGDPVAGAAVAYLITVTNDGPSTILGFTLTDTTAPVLVGATFGTPSMGSYNSATGAWTGLMLATGQSVTITLTGTVPGAARGDLENTAVVAPPAGVTDPDLDNNTSIVTDVIALVADLNVVKVRTSGQPVAGEAVTYQITVTNQGPTTIDSFSGLDTTAPALEDVDYMVNVGTYNPVTGIWTGPPLATGASVVFTLTGLVPAAATGLLVNTVTVAPPPDVTDPDPGDNTSTVTDEIDLVGDLSIVKSGPASDIPGTSLTYTLVVSNPGPSDVTGAAVSDALPGSLLGASWTAVYSLGSTGPGFGAGSLSGVLVNLLSGGTATFTIVGTIDPLATGSLQNTATVTPPVGFDDPNLENNTSSVTTALVPTADLAVVKTRTSGQPVAGLPVTYQIVVTNNGPSSVTSFTGTDITTPALEGLGFTVSTGNYNPVTGLWTADPGDSFATGETVIFTLTGKVPAGATGLLVNTVTGLPPDGVVDPDLSNNTSTVTDEIDLVGDLSIVKSGPASDIPGTSLTYTLVVTNPGPSNVTGAVVSDPLPASLQGASWSVIYSLGSTGPSDGVGSLSGVLVNLLSGGTATFTIVGTIDPLATESLQNTATVTPPVGFDDPNLENNTSSVTTALVPTADLAVVKTRTSGQPVAGLPVTYQIVVTNNGPSSVTSFTGTDTTIPALEGVDFLVSTGTYDPVLNIWTADPGDSLATGETVIFTLTGTVPAGATGLLVNTVTGLPPDGVIDPDLSNNTSTVTDEIAGVIDLTATKTGDETYKGGGFLNFTVVVTNQGPSFAAGVRVLDVLPPGIVNWSWTVSYTGVGSGTADGSPDSVTNSTASIDKLMNLAVLGTATFTITALTDGAFQKDITNTVVATLGQESATASWSSAYDGPINPTADVGALVVSNDDLCFGLPLVRVLDPDTGATLSQFLAYEASFRGSVRVATGDLTGDGVDEIVVAPGPGRPGQIRVFTADGVELPAYRTFPFGPAYRGGISVAVGNIDGIGGNEIIASRSSGLARVSVFGVDPLAVDPVTNVPIRSFIGIPGAYRNGAVVTAGDYGTFTNGMMFTTVADGIDEIAVGSNAGIRAQVRVFDASAAPRQVGSFFAIRPGFRGGVTLSTTRWNLDTAEDIIVGAGVGGRSIVEVYGGTPLSQFARLAVFSSFGRPNAAVNAAALDITGDGVADNLYGVQGRGGSGGTRGVRRFDRITTNTDTLPSSTSLRPPLRIAPITLRVTGG